MLLSFSPGNAFTRSQESLFFSSSDATKVCFSGNGKLSPPSPSDEVGFSLSLSFRELKESLSRLEALPGSFVSLAVIRELPPGARDGTEFPLADETLLSNEVTHSLDNDNKFPLTAEEDSPVTLKEELFLAVDKKSSEMDEEISPLAVDEEYPLTANEDTPLVDDEDSPFSNGVEFSLVDEGAIDKEESILDADEESLLPSEEEFLFVNEGGVSLDEEEGSPLVAEEESFLDTEDESSLDVVEESFLDAEVELFLPGGEENSLTEEMEFLLADESGMLLDDEEVHVFSLGSAMSLMLDAVPSLIVLLRCIFDLRLPLSSATEKDANADADSVPLFPFSVTAVSSGFFLSSSLPFVPESPLKESSFFFSPDRASFRGLLFLALFPLGLSEEELFFCCVLFLESVLFFVVSSDALLPLSSLLGVACLSLLLL